VRQYCTYFDHRFLDRGLAMLRSLRRVDPEALVSVLCLTPACHRVLAQLREPRVTLTTLADFERDNPDLVAAKDTRCLRDYYFTLSGCIAAATLADAAPGDIVTYLDADLLFHASPAPLFDAMANASVGLVGHRFHWWARRLEKYGRFNVGWVSFRADATGRAAARWWRDACIDWCYGCVDGDRYADQKYLEHMPAKFPGVIEIKHPGANVGPWNICRHSIEHGTGGALMVDGGFPLIFAHFSGVREAGRDIFLCSHLSYLGPFSETVRTGLYKPYLAELKRIREEIGGIPADPAPLLVDDSAPERSVWHRLSAHGRQLAARWAGHYIVAA